MLRKRWGFSGYVISDEEAVENLVLFHHYANNSMEATIDVITAGLNLELTTNRKDPYFFTISMMHIIPEGNLVGFGTCMFIAFSGLYICAYVQHIMYIVSVHACSAV